MHVHPGKRLRVSDRGCVWGLAFSSRSRSPRQDPEASLCLAAKEGRVSRGPLKAEEGQMSPGASTEAREKGRRRQGGRKMEAEDEMGGKLKTEMKKTL